MPKNREYEPAVQYTNQSRTFEKRKHSVTALAFLFGLCPSLGLSAAYSQWPLIGRAAIEPLHTTIIVVAAAALGLFYAVHQRCARQKCNETRVIYAALTVNWLAALVMAIGHRWTVHIANAAYHPAFVVAAFLFAVIAALSAVLFVPWMGRYRECYLIAFVCGQSAHEVVPFALRCMQGVANAPINYANLAVNLTRHPMATLTRPALHFTSEQYFFIVFGVMGAAIVAFVLLDQLAVCRREFAPGNVIQGNEYYYSDYDKYDVAGGKVPDSTFDLSVFKVGQLLVILFVMGLLSNAIVPVLVSSSTSAYGPRTLGAALEAVTLANPAGCLLASLVPHSSVHLVELCCGGIVLVGILIVHIAMQGAAPPFLHTFWGPFVVVSCGFGLKMLGFSWKCPSSTRVCQCTCQYVENCPLFVWFFRFLCGRCSPFYKVSSGYPLCQYSGINKESP